MKINILTFIILSIFGISEASAAHKSYGPLLPEVMTTAAVYSLSGCDMSGTTDATVCVQNQLDFYGGGKGGIVAFNGKLLINSNLTIPVGVSLQGQCEMPGTPGNNAIAPYGSYTCGVLMVSNSATIKLSSGSNLSHILIYRAGMTFPATNTTAFAGTAITAIGDDASVTSAMVLGFDKAFFASGVQRPRIEYLWADNNNGIEITNSLDIPWISHVHQWPFATIASPGATICRSGNAIWLHDTVDWAHITDVFSYCYKRGILLNNVNSTNIMGAGADGVLSVDNVGLEILGSSADTHVSSFQAATNQAAAVHLAFSGVAYFRDTSVWGGTNHAFLIDSGDAMIQGGLLGTNNAITNGITVSNSNSRVLINGIRFGTLNGYAITSTVATSKVVIGDDNDFGPFSAGVGSTLMVSPSLSASTNLSLPNTGSVFNVSGTTTIGYINNGWAGRCITLIFSNPVTINNVSGGYNSVRLAGGNFTAASSDSLTLCHNGAQWFERSRVH